MTKPKALGYIRVSTTRQEMDGRSLDWQIGVIRATTQKLGFDCVAIYGDTGSAAGPAPGKRLDLVDLLREAKRPGAVIFVTDATRLGRHPKLAVHFDDPDLKVYDIDLRRIISKPELKKAFIAGAADAAEIRERASTAAKLAGRRPPDPKKGGDARAAAMRSEVDDRRIAISEAFRLLEVELGRRPSLREAAAEFNRRGFKVAGKVGPWHHGMIHTALKEAPRFIIEPEAMFDLLL